MIDPSEVSGFLASVRDVYTDAERALGKAVARAARDYLTDDEEAAQAALVQLRGDAAEQVARLDLRGATTVDRAIRAAGFRGVDLADADIRTLRRPVKTAPSSVNVQALDRLAASTVDLVTDRHRSILRTIVDDFRRIISRATAGILGGGATQREAAQRAVWAWMDKGITSFVDRTGRRWRLSTYAEMATRTAGIRAMVDGHLDRLDDAGIDLVYVSDHLEECHLCAPWEGKVLRSRSGTIGMVSLPSEVEDVPVSVDIVGTVAMARAAGLFHPNCRHSLNAYLPGLTKVPEATESEVPREARIRQREIERNLRQWKGREATAMGPRARTQARQKVRTWEATMRDHLERNPHLRRLRERERPGAGFTPTPAMKAREGEPFPDAPSAHRRVAELSDEELEDAYVQAVSDPDLVDEDLLDRLTLEEEHREAVRDRVSRRREQDRARRARRRDERLDEFGRLVEEEGLDEEEAAFQALGITPEKQRRQEAIRNLREYGYVGRSFDQLSALAFRDHLFAAYIEAEGHDDVKGVHTSKAARERGIDEYAVWQGTEAFARKWASEELRRYWDEHGGRPNLATFRAQLLQDGATLRAMRGTGGGDFLQ